MAEIVDPKGRNPSQFRHTPEPLPEVPGVRPFEITSEPGVGLGREAADCIRSDLSRSLFVESGEHARGPVFKFASGPAPVILPPVIEEVDKFNTFEAERGEAPLHRHIRTGLGEHRLCRVYIGLVGILADDPAMLVLVADVQRARLMDVDAFGQFPTRFGHSPPHAARGSA